MFSRFLSERSFSEFTFRSDFFPDITDREFWDKNADGEIIKEAEQALDYEYPIIRATAFMHYKADGNRTVMQDPHFDRRNHLTLFALAELMENKGRFLPQIVDGVFAICEETFWGVSAHMPNQRILNPSIPDPDDHYIDLFAAETAEHMVMIYHLLKKPLGEFCPEILLRIARELERRIKRPYLLDCHYSWMGYGRAVNNWNPWILSNLLTVFLLSERDELRLHTALKKMFTEIQHYYDSMPDDGGCDEGPGYWNRAGASLFEFVYQLKQSSGGELDLFGDGKLGRIASYMQKAHIASNLFVSIADAHSKGIAQPMVLLYGFARETKQEKLMNFAAAVYRERSDDAPVYNYKQRTLRRFLYHVEFFSEITGYPVSYPLHEPFEYLPELQLASVRRGDMALFLKGGHNAESHNHNDVGSILFYDGATPVVIDVGINTYTRFTFDNRYRYTLIPWTRTAYHNLPLVNGREQSHGRDFRCEEFSASAERLLLSFAAAYPAEAGISGLTREAVLTENGMSCTDTFSFEDAEKRKVTEVLMSVRPVTRDGGDVIIDGRYRVRTEGEITTEFIPFEDKVLEGDWSTDGATRIMISFDGRDTVNYTIEKI